MPMTSTRSHAGGYLARDHIIIDLENIELSTTGCDIFISSGCEEVQAMERFGEVRAVMFTCFPEDDFYLMQSSRPLDGN